MTLITRLKSGVTNLEGMAGSLREFVNDRKRFWVTRLCHLILNLYTSKSADQKLERLEFQKMRISKSILHGMVQERRVFIHYGKTLEVECLD